MSTVFLNRVESGMNNAYRPPQFFCREKGRFSAAFRLETRIYLLKNNIAELRQRFSSVCGANMRHGERAGTVLG